MSTKTDQQQTPFRAALRKQENKRPIYGTTENFNWFTAGWNAALREAAGRAHSEADQYSERKEQSPPLCISECFRRFCRDLDGLKQPEGGDADAGTERREGAMGTENLHAPPQGVTAGQTTPGEQQLPDLPPACEGDHIARKVEQAEPKNSQTKCCIRCNGRGHPEGEIHACVDCGGRGYVLLQPLPACRWRRYER